MKKVFYFACILMPSFCMAQDGTTTITTQQTTTTPGNTTINMNTGGTGMTGTTTQQTTIITTTTTTNSGDVSQGQQQTQSQQTTPATEGCQEPMRHEDFESAKNSIAEKTFEDSKLTLAKQIASSNCLLSGQVRAIMQLFTFENSKLDFAKYAYPYTVDKSNYFKVDDAFQFDNSSQELNNYISSLPK